MQERLVSRFVSGLSVDITPPDLETRIAILQNKAQSLGFNIPIEVLSYVAGHIQSNVRELEGALMRLQAYSVMVGQDISTDLAAEALQSFLPGGDENYFRFMISKAPLRNTTILRSKILKERKERRRWFNHVKSRCIFLVN